MIDLDAALEYVRANRDAHLRQLIELLRIPSVSTLPEHRPDIDAAAQWLAEELNRVGMTRTTIMTTPGHPVVYGERLDAPGKATVLVYGHYDVQPVDPIDEWESAPFEPTVRGDDLYARGASDMKGQLFAQLKAVEALAAHGGVPVNLKFLFEGEEEVGSPHLATFIGANHALLGCDFVINCDSGILRPDLPAIVYALRGLAYFEVEVHGPAKDLHSGVFGGAVHNPVQALCELIAGMHDAEGRVTLPGFYDKVRPLAPDEREALGRLPTTEDDWQRLSGVPALHGESGYTSTERVGARPSLDVNGIIGGFTGEGAKTVLPAKATAKVSMRLVPDQDEAEVCGQLREYMTQHAPETVTWQVREMAHGPGAVMNRHSPYMRAAVKALEQTFGVEPVFKREGGSVPVVGLMQKKLGVDSIMLGFSLPDDGVHGPNEKQHLPTLFKGIEAHVRFLAALGNIESGDADIESGDADIESGGRNNPG